MVAGYDQAAHPNCAGEPILDDPYAAQSAPKDPAKDPAGAAPNGIREQLSATIEAALRVGRAHLSLARAELGEIASEGKRVGILAGIAFGCLFFAGLLVPVGLTL